MNIRNVKRALLLACAEKLQSWSESIVRTIETGTKGGSHAPDINSSLKGSEYHVSKAGKVDPSEIPGEQVKNVTGRPPEHWLQVVQRAAPQLLRTMEEDRGSETRDETENDLTPHVNTVEDRVHVPLRENTEQSEILQQASGKMKKETPQSFRNKKTLQKKIIPEQGMDSYEHSGQKPEIKEDGDTPVITVSHTKKTSPKPADSFPEKKTPAASGRRTDHTGEDDIASSGDSMENEKAAKINDSLPDFEIPDASDQSPDVRVQNKASVPEQTIYRYSVPPDIHRRHAVAGQPVHQSRTGVKEKTYVSGTVYKKTAESGPYPMPGTAGESGQQPSSFVRDHDKEVIQSPLSVISKKYPSSPAQCNKTETDYSPYIISNGINSRDLWPELPQKLPQSPDKGRRSTTISGDTADGPWPELPEGDSLQSFQEQITDLIEHERLQRLTSEQRGIPWSV